MFELDAKKLRRLENDLTKFAKRALPFAVRNGLNSTAFEARREWAEQLGKKMVLRNTFTTRSLRVEKATGLDLNTMQARVGSVADYMATQEHGGTESKKGKHGKPIPTSVAAGQGMKTRPRKRAVQRKNWMGAVTLASGIRGSRQRRNAFAIAQAAKGSGTAFLDLGRRKGLFRVTGTKKGLKVRMIWDLSRPSVVIKRNPTLQHTLKAIEPRLPELHEKAIIEQLKRHRVLGY